MEKPRIVVRGRDLATIIYVWLRDAPKWVWGSNPAYERLRKQKRHDPGAEPDPRREVASLIAAEIDRLDWEVSYEAPGSPTDITAKPRQGD